MEDREMAYRLAGVILRIDETVFPDNHISRVELILRPPEDERHWVAYHYGKRIPEHYDVFVPGLYDWLRKQLEVDEGKGIAHLAMMESATDEAPSFTEDELLVAIAAHEVRHRLQRLEKVTLFTPKTTEPAFLGWAIQKLGHRGQEFDAKVIGFLAAREWRLGHTSAEDMAMVIRMKPKRLR